MLSERERQVLEEMEREVSAEDPRLAQSLQATSGKRALWSDRWPYTAVIAVAWTLAAVCLLLGLAGAVLTAGALGAVAFALRSWLFRDRSGEGAERPDGSEGEDPPLHPG